MFSSFLSKLFQTNMNFLSSFLDDSVDNNNITSDEMTVDCSWADELGLNSVPNNLHVVPYYDLTEVIVEKLSEVTSDEMSWNDDDRELYPNNL